MSDSSVSTSVTSFAIGSRLTIALLLIADGRKKQSFPSAPSSQQARNNLKLQGGNRRQLVATNSNSNNSTNASEESASANELKKTAASKSFWDLMPKAAQARMGRLGKQ